MTPQQLLSAYKSGLLSTDQVKEELAKLSSEVREYPLSEGQKGLWMLQKMVPSMTAYNVPICFKMHCLLDIPLFKTACEFLLKQYPVLTHRIGENKGMVFQRVRPSQDLYFKTKDVSSLSSRKILDLLRQKAKQPFDLSKDSLMRVYVLSPSVRESFVLILVHHIVFDGSSFPLLVKTLLDAYAGLLKGEQPVLTPPGAGYHDFVAWEQDLLKGETAKGHLEFWQKHLSGPLPVMTFYGKHPDLSSQPFEGQTCTQYLDEDLTRKIRRLAVDLKVNLSVVFLGIFKVLLHQYTGLSDIIVGMPFMGRPREHFESLVGYFINMMAMRTRKVGETPFSELLRQLQGNLIEGMGHAAYPFPALVKALNVPRSLSGSPVFQVSFAFQNFIQASAMETFEEMYNDAFGVDFVDGIHQEGEYELEMEIFEQQHRCLVNLKYAPRVFTSRQIREMMAAYITLAQGVCCDPTKKSGAYPALSQEETAFLVSKLNTTQTDFPNHRVHELFGQQVRRNPDHTALVDNDIRLTYGQLNERVDQLSLHLTSLGLAPESRVGICANRSADMIIGVLAILKANGAYVPIDPGYPKDRIGLMLTVCDIKMVLTQNALVHLLPDTIDRVVCLDSPLESPLEFFSAGPTDLPGTLPGQNNLSFSADTCLAYVMFTSGTTGTPKGVAVTHKNIVRLVRHRGFDFLNQQARVLQYAPLSFDASTFEIWGALCNGATLVMAPPGRLDPEDLEQTLKENRVSVLWLTSALFNQMAQHRASAFRGIKYLLAGGDVLHPAPIKKVFETHPDIVVINGYGPTENTTFSTLYVMDKNRVPDHFVPIGTPLDNTLCYIVNENLVPVPFGVAGELLLGGAGIARGYLNHPQLTREKFIPNPFDSDPHSIVYRTGDLVRYLPDHNIQFLGRRDNQVKIRGFRIEPGEIETRLALHPGIQECVVVVKERASGKLLVAYYVETSFENKLNPGKLCDYLKGYLPVHLIPSFFIRLDQIPVTANGKPDRAALALKKLALAKANISLKPESDVQRAILGIWKDILEVDNIGMEDGFFDVGGDSITAVLVSERIKADLAPRFSTTDLFKYPNIREISRFLTEQARPADPAVKPLLPQDRPDDPGYGPSEAPIDAPVDSPRGGPAPCPDHYHDSLAVIGISCEFPGAKNQDQFWENLVQGKESICFYAPEELKTLGVPEELIVDPGYVPIRSTIEDKDKFDPGFFNLSPRDAQFMDPQFRLLLQHAWKAFEDAGHVPGNTPKTAVFMSAANNFYNALPAADDAGLKGHPDTYSAWVLAQNGTIPTMISHKLGLKGPSFFVHSNCSSSLVGLSSAFQSLGANQADYALVGAANLFAQSPIGYIHRPGLNFSSDGHLKAFDAAADGMVGGEGVAVVLLKKANLAVRDKDHIYALLRGIGVNNDGADKVGYYAPGISGQTEVIRTVMAGTHIDPESISYIEAHGTGTKLGDPIEFNALCEAFKGVTSKKQFCGIGSVKTNIGHLDCAAGLAGFIKLALCLHNQKIPPSLHYQTANPAMDMAGSPFYVVKTLENLGPRPTPHLAALSSFGLGGTNTHAILEQYPAPKELALPAEPSLFFIPLSARSWESLAAYAADLVSFVRTRETIPLSALARTLQTGRAAMEKRAAFIVRDCRDLISQLDLFVQGNPAALKGEILSSKDTMDIFETDEDHRELIQVWIKKGKLLKLARLWVKGLEMDWNHFYPQGLPGRISLPTYAFAKHVHPLAKPAPVTSGKHPFISLLLHHIDPRPSLEERSGLVFKTVIFPEFPLVAGHTANGFPMLPVSSALEMVRAAMTHILGNQPIEIEEIFFLAPLVVMETTVLHFVLVAADSGAYDFRIQSLSKPPVLFSRGRVAPCEDPEACFMDLSAMEWAAPSPMEPREFFERLSIIGMEYHKDLRCLNRIWAEKDQVFAELEIKTNPGPYHCHPAMTDLALHTRIGLAMDRTDTAPVTRIQQIKIFDNLPLKIISCITSLGPGKGHGLVLMNPDGKILVTMGMIGSLPELSSDTNYAVVWEPRPPSKEKTLEPKASPVQTSVVVSSGSCLGFEKTLGTVLRTQTRPTMRQDRVVLIQMGDHTQNLGPDEWVCDEKEARGFSTCLDKTGPVDCLYFLAGNGKTEAGKLADLPDTGFPEILLLRLIKHVKQKNDGRTINCFIITLDTFSIWDTRTRFRGAGITGLAYSMAQGDRYLKVRNMDISAQDLNDPKSRERLVRQIQEIAPSQRGEVIKPLGGICYGQRFLPIDFQDLEPVTALKQHGVYAILGGSGTVGMVITRYLIREFEARVIWIGRRAETDPSIVQKRASLKLFGTPPLYVQADATDPAQLQAAVSRIKTRCPSINGAIFSPVVMNHENTIEKTSEKEFNQVLEVKTQGSINFYAAFKAEPLDFMCYFSSAQAFCFSGAVHFCAYAAGISFSDAFVRSLQGCSKFPVGTINWGFWKSPVKGVSLNKSLVKGILNSTGFLENREGFACFKRFTGLLTRGVLHQVLCLRASEPVRKLMDIPARETAVLAQKHYNPILGTLAGIVQPDSDNLLPLLKGIDPSIFYQWITRLLYCQLQELKIFGPDDPPKTLAALGKKAGILDKYGRWFVEAVSILARSGHVRVENKKMAGAVFPDKDQGRIWEDWDRAKAGVLGSSEMKAHMELVVRCVRSLPEILTGKIPATDILFPGSSMAMVETIYKKSALSDYFNRLVADMAEAFVKERFKQDPGAKIRIVEIGAGTGGTTAVVLPRLKPFEDRITYLYTDISQSFLLFAQKTYAQEFPFLKYQVWNVEKPPEDYGIDIGTYDMVIATNVLHATRNMTKTLDHAKAVLKTNGVILINEVVQNTLMGTLSFGLTDGWWLYEDGYLRIPGSPMVAVPTWKKLLAKTGFREICFPAESAIQTGQQIIAAQSNGFIRQQVKPAGTRQEKLQVSTRVLGQNLAKGVFQKAGTKQTIAAIIRDELSTALKMPVETIEDQTSFSDYGVDSIISVNFIDRINDRLEIDLNTAIVFDYTSVAALSDYILKTMGHKRTDTDQMEELEKQFRADEISALSVLEALGHDR